MTGILLLGNDDQYYLEIGSIIYGPYKLEKDAVSAFKCGTYANTPCSQSLLDYRLLKSLY